MMVHEWSHLRWGVFDEYESSKDKLLYASSRGTKTEATACSVNLAKEGKVKNVLGKDCSAFNVHNSCRYVPPKKPTAKGSIMFKQFISSVNTFCDDGDDESTKHNAMAPNSQNIYCQYRSTWDVIQSHEDFKDGNNPPGPIDRNTKPKFNIVRSGSQKDNVVLVLDLSLSLRIGNRIDALRQAARLFIAGVGDGTSISLVTFQDSAARRLVLTEIMNSKDRESIMNILPTKDELNGGTSIGAGIKEALEVLTGLEIDDTTKPSDIPPSGGTIVVITDGQETAKPYIKSITPLVSAAKVMVYPVGLGPGASQNLSLLSEPTSRVTYFVDTDEKQTSTQKLSEVMVTVLDQMRQSSTSRTIYLHSLSVLVSPMMRVSRDVIVDVEVGMHTVFMFMWNKHVTRKQTIRVTLISPSGIVMNKTNSEFHVDRSFMTIQISLLDKAESGTWKYKIYNRGTVEQFIAVSVTSKQADTADNPVTVEARLSETVVSYPSPVIISADVKKGYMVVVGATVEATISRSGMSPMKLMLLDNGIAPDMSAGDGTYTAYFTIYVGDGQYNVVVKTAAAANAAKMMRMVQTDDLMAFSDQELKAIGMTRPHKSQERQIMSKFSRIQSAGSFHLKGFDSSLDLIPPARVMDLRVVHSSRSESTATLNWVAAGDDAYSGKADKFNLRISSDFYGLLRRFNESAEVSYSNIVGGSLIPVEGGNVQEVTVKVPQGTDTYFAALETYDKYGNPSGVSNIVRLDLQESYTSTVTKLRNFVVRIFLG
ncbi:calcium-activated chloride channel regulator 1-like isoform X2 [Corticium candelabrum]|nr:calcium-activated chloride channel regulator 1-like isoform X2 [Corticium candelabrum]XP_062510858.1 calcium-activated chloride channel regulator 1-like isoform X2 [Corticium candelabrum]